MLKEEDKNTSDFHGDVEQEVKQDNKNTGFKGNENLENDMDLETEIDKEEDEVENVEEDEVSEVNLEEELKSENIKLKSENEKIHNEFKTLQDRLSRTAAEYDNFRKRTAKEKEAIYSDACRDILKEILPVLDNLERAVEVEGDMDDLKKGVEMTIRQFNTAFEKLNVEEISTEGEFDPNIHNAVMHIEDDNYDKNSIVEVFQKGYKREDKIIRYSMVKVAN
ncbi:nucleotide exchange factor GrpE [Clostridium kluyveri]|uniref:Protein GrpE n=1 Tax=Clostridium kluyveri TaxID=1534 RepID=A0A1L5F625_CLOKL|nr:nucleotide exchange factor GrpE [Clostridium kluyveri]APM38280.1 nucleotide exchange factor GrpE [Clostridium kluyveri]UZQ51709.1 nucleotide exchange factor GrpE [Clostridium kluyveri]